VNILLVDDEVEILELIEMAFEAHSNSTILKAQSGFEAIEKLKQRKFDLVVSDFNMPNGTGGDLYSYIIQHDLDVKFVLCSAGSSKQHPAFSNEGKFFYHIEKPMITKGVEHCMQKLLQVEKSYFLNMVEFVPVSIGILLNLEILPMDLYLKINNDKYVKILNTNDNFDEADFIKYVQKSVFKLYVDKKDYDTLKLKIEKSLLEKIDTLRASTGNIDIASTCHDLIHQYVAEYGFNANISYAINESIDAAIRMIKNSSELTFLFNKILSNKNSYLTRHSLLLSVFTPMLAKKINWNNRIMEHKLVVVSLFHDIALKEDENETLYLHKKNSSKNFRDHSELSAELIRKVENVPPDTDVIILEHHEIGQGIGFPKGIPFTKISPLGLLFSFAHHFIDYLIGSGSAVEALEKSKELSKLTGQYRFFYSALEELDIF
jgi:response regulator RpfG family c-di-GMP phosphodiesterase